MSAFRTKSMQGGNDQCASAVSGGSQAQSRRRLATAGIAGCLDSNQPGHRVGAAQPSRSFWRLVGITECAGACQCLRCVALNRRRTQHGGPPSASVESSAPRHRSFHCTTWQARQKTLRPDSRSCSLRRLADRAADHRCDTRNLCCHRCHYC